MTASAKPRKLTRREALKIGGGALLGGSALLGAAVTGCGGGGDDGAGQAGLADRTTVRFMTAQTLEKHRSLEPLIAEFMEIHPGIRIEHIKVPWDQAHSKYLTAILGGAPPDVMTIPSWWVTEFRAMGALEDLGPWVRDWPHLQGYSEQVKRLTRATMAFDGDQVFGLPTEVAVRSMFYRTEWLDEQGLAPAETREEWRALLEKITDPSRQRYGYALRGARGGFWSWWAIAQEFAGSNAWFDEDHRCIINSPDHVAGLSYWNDLYQDGLAPPDSLNWGFNELVQGFWSGLCGTMEQDPEVVRTCLEHGLDEDRLAITVMPRRSKGPRGPVRRGVYIHVVGLPQQGRSLDVSRLADGARAAAPVLQGRQHDPALRQCDGGPRLRAGSLPVFRGNGYGSGPSCRTGIPTTCRRWGSFWRCG